MTRWRQGQSVPHHVYAMSGDEPDTWPWPGGDPPVATFFDPDDALRAVEAVNGGLTEDSIGIRAERDALRDELRVEVQRRDDVIAELRRVIQVRDNRIGVLERTLAGSRGSDNPMVVHGTLSQERDDGDGELHATCKCGVTATFTDEPGGRSAHVAAQAWWEQHQREAADDGIADALRRVARGERT